MYFFEESILTEALLDTPTFEVPKNHLVLLFWSFKSPLMLYFDNILVFIVNKRVS